MILLINICEDPLHYFEFVNPIEDILKAASVKYFVKHYLDILPADIGRADKIIICGTSLKDNAFIKDIDKFKFLLEFKKPVLGICGGSHILGLLLGHKLKKDKKIGLKELILEREFLGARGMIQAYFLHQFHVLPEVFQKDNFYATLFHPEVRNEEIIINFTGI